MSSGAPMAPNVSMRPKSATIGTIAAKETIQTNRTVTSLPVMRDSSGALMPSAFPPDGDVTDIPIVLTVRTKQIAVCLRFGLKIILLIYLNIFLKQ